MTMRTLILAILLLLAAGCVPISGVESENIAAEAASSLTTPLEVLTFEGNGDTFLAHIDAVMAERGRPDSHQRVEVVTSDGMTWQGESLRYGDAQAVLLQQAQAGAKTAIAFDVPVDADLAAILANQDLPAAQPLYSAHPQIQFVRARLGDADTWTFDVTLTYPDRGWEDYADGWQIETREREILGTRILLHPHVDEQPFTRSLSGVAIPGDLNEIVVRSHNLISGYAPETVIVPIGESGTGDLFEVVR